jgi:GAF domain-containing protein
VGERTTGTYPLPATLVVEGRVVVSGNVRAVLGQDTLEALEVVADTIAQGIERKRAEEKLARLNRTLQTVNECNQALVRATEEYELLRSVCRILVEFGGLRMAWVGYREFNEDKTVRPVAQAGYEAGYLDQINSTWADIDRGRGPTNSDPNRCDVLDQEHCQRSEYVSVANRGAIAWRPTFLPLMSHGERLVRLHFTPRTRCLH